MLWCQDIQKPKRNTQHLLIWVLFSNNCEKKSSFKHLVISSLMRSPTASITSFWIVFEVHLAFLFPFHKYSRWIGAVPAIFSRITHVTKFFWVVIMVATQWNNLLSMKQHYYNYLIHNVHIRFKIFTVFLGNQVWHSFCWLCHRFYQIISGKNYLFIKLSVSCIVKIPSLPDTLCRFT